MDQEARDVSFTVSGWDEDGVTSGREGERRVR